MHSSENVDHPGVLTVFPLVSLEALIHQPTVDVGPGICSSPPSCACSSYRLGFKEQHSLPFESPSPCIHPSCPVGPYAFQRPHPGSLKALWQDTVEMWWDVSSLAVFVLQPENSSKQELVYVCVMQPLTVPPLTPLWVSIVYVFRRFPHTEHCLFAPQACSWNYCMFCNHLTACLYLGLMLLCLCIKYACVCTCVLCVCVCGDPYSSPCCCRDHWALTPHSTASSTPPTPPQGNRCSSPSCD